MNIRRHTRDGPGPEKAAPKRITLTTEIEGRIEDDKLVFDGRTETASGAVREFRGKIKLPEALARIARGKPVPTVQRTTMSSRLVKLWWALLIALLVAGVTIWLRDHPEYARKALYYTFRFLSWLFWQS